MSQSAITLAFERWKASATEAQQPVILDEFVLANVPNLDPSKPIDRNEGLPDAKYIMHRQAVNKTGVVNQNAVAYSVTIGAEIGDFDFNWIGLLNKQSGTVAMIVHAPTQRKIKTQAGQQGNVLTRSFLLEYLGASKETAITTPAEMWQIDFTARLSGIDEMQRLINRDKYGVASFFNNGFLVAKAGNQFYITKGLGYIEGLRAELAENKNITVTNQATKVWVDVSYQGNITSDWGVHIAITVKPDLKNYTDNAGFAHFVFAVASISVTGVITDLRPKGTLDAQYFEDALKKHEQSRNHPDATTTVKGFTKLNNQVGDSENTALTPYGAKKELEKYQPKGNYQPAGNYVSTETFNLEINKKIDKTSLSQQLAYDVNKVPSLDLVTKELGNKQPKGDYQPAGDYATTKDLEKKFDKTGGHITGDVRITDGKSLRVNAPNNNGDTFIITREDGTSWIGNSYTAISINKDGLYSGNNPVVTTDRLRNGAYRSISGDAVFSGKNASAPLSMQTYADFRKVISYDVAESYPEGVSGGIATGKQIHKPELDMVCLLNIRGWHDKSGATACGQIYITSTGNIGFRYNQYNAEDNAHYLMPVDIYCTNNTTVDNDGFIRKLGYTDNSIVFPIPWSQPTPPPGYLVCNGQWFNTSTYPKLAIAYPSGKLPDLRGEFIRGLDSGRGIDAGRSILSAQKGNSLLSTNLFNIDGEVAKQFETKIDYIGYTGTNNSGSYGILQQIEGKNGNETRPRNIAFLYIVRAA